MCGAELHTLPEGVQRVARALQDAAHPHAPVMLDGAARTAQEAADGLGVQLGQIAKSVIFKRKEDGVAVLVVASGDRRVDEKKVSALVGKIGRADADFVKAQTGFTIGGVSPVAHLNAPVTLLDQDLWRFEDIWAAAGHPHGVFQLKPDDLKRLTAAPVAADALQALGKTVLLSRCAEFHRIAAFLHRYTSKPIGMILSIGLLNELFKPKWSENLAGGLLESFGRLFKEGVTLYVFPWKN